MKQKVWHEIETVEEGKYPEHIWNKYWNSKNLEGTLFYEDFDEIFPQAQLLSSKLKYYYSPDYYLDIEIRFNRYYLFGKTPRKVLTVSYAYEELCDDKQWHRSFKEIVLKDALLTPVEDWDYTEEVFENETA